MKPNDNKENKGVKTLCERYRKAFRIPENLNHYSDEDLKKAERSFIRYCLHQGKVAPFSPEHPVPR